VTFLILLIVWGGFGYANQLAHGLIVTLMRDSVSWGFYIGNFTFLVGVAAASVMLVIPAYIYHWKPLKEIVIFWRIISHMRCYYVPVFIIVDIGNP